ncbi:hypothetical protein H6790_00665 [Candidatus Nomurabacteria bacterium]|nr:hypothetical protein [Candidatus Nomurabacteria bacterium]MCB9820445.1 hypothetical protein [Candidatus Nomurabacteria bacterium]
MKRKRLIILILIVLGLIIVFAVFGRGKQVSTQNTDQSGRSGFSDIFSNLGNLFSPSNNTGTPTDNTNQNNQIDNTIQDGSVYTTLKKVSSEPVAGYTFYDYEEKIEYTNQDGKKEEVVENKNLIRYMKKTTGFVSDTNTQVFPLTEVRISNTTIPKIQEAVFFNNATGVITRLLDDDLETIKTFQGTITPGSGSQPGNVTGSFIEENIPEIAISPNGTNMVYYKKSNYDTFFYNKNLLTSGNDSFFNTSFYSWLMDFTNENTLTLSTKGSYYTDGYVYSLHLDGKLNKILGGKKGMVGKLSPNENYLLYSISQGNSFKLYLYDIKEGRDVDTGIRTLVDKCVWGKVSQYIYCGVPQNPLSGIYPDDWYLGNKNFSDSIWKINVSTNSAFKISDVSSESKEDIDVIELQINSLDNRLGFINKNDYSLWMLDL